MKPIYRQIGNDTSIFVYDINGYFIGMSFLISIYP